MEKDSKVILGLYYSRDDSTHAAIIALTPNTFQKYKCFPVEERVPWSQECPYIADPNDKHCDPPQSKPQQQQAEPNTLGQRLVLLSAYSSRHNLKVFNDSGILPDLGLCLLTFISIPGQNFLVIKGVLKRC